jgi:CheY-like chemotaxis protein
MDRSIDPKPPSRGDDPATSRGLPGQVLDNLLEGVQVISPEYLYLYVNDAVEPVLRRLLGEDVDIHVELDHDLGSAEVDPSQIEQVLLNLAVNARDAMPLGGTLTIETTNAVLDNAYAARHVATKPGRYVQLAVSDTGEGMDEATQAQVFEPFFTTKDRDKGTGLGLAMVYGIVKQSGGNIWVYSEVGRGTTFKMYVPRVDARPDVLSSIPDTDSLLGNEMVLVAEDVAEIGRFVKRVLTQVGYRVLVAGDGIEAMQLAEDHDGVIDLLLTDVVMPRMSGRELAKKLAATRSGLKVVYMSGYTDSTTIQHGILERGVHLLAKPFSADDLLRMIRHVLDERTG